MASERAASADLLRNFSIQKFDLSYMTADEKPLLKRKLEGELAQVRRVSRRLFPEEEDHKLQKADDQPPPASKNLLRPINKQAVQKQLANLSQQEMPLKVLQFLERFGCHGNKRGRIDVDIDKLDGEALFELHQILNKSTHRRPARERILQKLQRGPCRKSTCSRMNSHSIPQDDSTQPVPTGTKDSERSSRIVDHESLVPAYSASKKISAKRSRDNLVCVPDHTITNPTAARADDPEEEHRNLEASPSKALRAATLKSRFADTIFRAQEKLVLHKCERSDPETLQLELKELKQRQGEERRRIKAQGKAAEEELKRRREREKARKAARLKLQKIEKTVEIHDCYHIWEDLEKLGYAQPIHLSKKQLADLMDEDIKSELGHGG